MNSIAQKASTLKSGTLFITTTKRIPSLDWELLDESKYIMSWGNASIFIQIKK